MQAKYKKQQDEKGESILSEEDAAISQETLDAAKEGDEQAFEILYDQSYPMVSATVKSIVRNQEPVQDIIQEVYIKVFRELKKLRKATCFIPWIRRIAHNCAVDYTKRSMELPLSQVHNPEEGTAEEEESRTEHIPEAAVLQSEKREIVRHILSDLPEEQRRTAVLYYMEDFSVDEIADDLGVSPNTVKSRLYYARRKLRRKIEEMEKQGIRLRSLPPFAFFAAQFCRVRPGGKKLTVKRKTFLMKFAAFMTMICLFVGTTSFHVTDERKNTPDYAYAETEDEGDTEKTEVETEEGAETAGAFANMLETSSACVGEGVYPEPEANHYYFLGTSIDTESIRTLTFLDRMDAAPEDAIDVSYANDGTVIAWMTEAEDGLYDMYIAADGKIILPISCEDIFWNMTNLVSIDFGDNLDTTRVTDMRYMFRGCESLTELDLSCFDTSKVTDMQSMFAECRSLTDVVLESFDTSSVTSVEAMFYNCSSLKNVDISNFDTSKVDTFDLMFTYCSSLAEIDVSNLNTSEGTSFWQMFAGCESLTELDLSSFDTSKAEDLSEMFSLCHSLESVNLRSFDTLNVTTMMGMFHQCSSLKELDLSSFDTSNVEDMSHMFSRATALTRVDFSNFQTESLTSVDYMFYETTETLKEEFSSQIEAATDSRGELLSAEEVFGNP